MVVPTTGGIRPMVSPAGGIRSRVVPTGGRPPVALSCNPEQAEILTKMAGGNIAGMAVLSPAASGATRTLANLACQTLADGGRMLAVSRERAHLADLLAALPESVRRLAAAPLFGEGENRRQIAAAARAAAALAAETDREKTSVALKEDAAERESILRDIAELEAQNARASAPHFSPVSPMFAEILPRPTLAHLAQWTMDNAEKFNWFADRPSVTDFPRHIDDLLIARAALGPHLSAPNHSPAQTADDKNGEGTEGTETGMGTGTGGSGSGGESDTVWVMEHPDRDPELDAPSLPSAAAGEDALPESVAALAEKMGADRKEMEKLEWTGGLLENFFTDADFGPSYRRCREELRVLALRRKSVAGVHHPDLEAILTPSALSALRKKANPFLFWVPAGDPKARKVLDDFRLEGRHPRNLADWRKILAFAAWLEECGRFAAKWNREAAADIGDERARAPESARSHPSWARKTDEALCRMESVLRCASVLREKAAVLTAEVARAGAPKWAELLRSADASALPEDWRDAWRWGCARAALDNLEKDGESFELDERLREKRADLAALESRMVERRIALAVCGMSRAEWAEATAAEAERILPQMPLVIAPSWRANEWLPARFGIFETAAMDGGSSSPASELALLLRGKRAVVFGDDRRFAPSVFGEDSFQPGGGSGQDGAGGSGWEWESVYDFARWAWPADAVFLREVYGAAWPLSEIVSGLFYDGGLCPVCFPSAGERLGSPLVGVWVRRGVLDGGRNEWEARALCGELERIFADPRTAARSVGIAALSGEQADYARALAGGRFDEGDLSARDFACDDAESWGAGGGGRRRDVCLVSLADSPGRGDAPVSMRARRRLNLALGVGRLQLRLAHSLSRDDLRDEADLRRRLLGRFYARGAEDLTAKPTAAVGVERTQRSAVTPIGGLRKRPGLAAAGKSAGVAEKTETGGKSMGLEFERDLCARLRGLGYSARLGVGALGLRVGVVVEGENGARLGAELDAGESMADWTGVLLRRSRLERGGWHFWRAHAADYILEPERVLGDLRARLSASDIRPWEGAPPPTAETRVYNPVEEA